MQVFVGMSGWAYKEWKGTFYPADIKPDQMLRYYASRFAAVEINNSFYRMPAEHVLLGWAEQVPEDFRFVVKAPRRVTHYRPLADEDGSLEYFLQTANVLGDKLGAMLFQCPPSFKKDAARLQRFLARIPRTWRSAMEFRHASWFDDEVFGILREHDVALVVAEDDDGVTPVVPTASWGYLRLRKTSYNKDELTAWVSRIAASGWSTAYVFVKHDEDGRAGPPAAIALYDALR